MGYKITAVVYYDDNFKRKFGEEADTRIDAIMALVDEQFDEMQVKIIQYLPSMVANPSAFLPAYIRSRLTKDSCNCCSSSS